MNSNHPEKPHFDRIFALEREIVERRGDIKELYSAAKQSDIDVKLLRRSVKLALEDEDKKKERRALEDTAEQLLVRIGQLAGSPLGDAAMNRAAE